MPSTVLPLTSRDGDSDPNEFGIENPSSVMPVAVLIPANIVNTVWDSNTRREIPPESTTHIFLM